MWRKKYLYVLRPLIALEWIDRGLGPVPIEFHVLLNAILPEGVVRVAIDELIEAKKAGAELDRGPRIPEIDDYIRMELARFKESGRGYSPGPEVDDGRLDRLFQSILDAEGR